MNYNVIYNIDCTEGIKFLDDKSVQCIITSPPYWGLRDYGSEHQLGAETTPDEYIKKLCDVFLDCNRVLKDDGVLYVNIADSYFRNGGKSKGANPKAKIGNTKKGIQKGNCKVPEGYLENVDKNWMNDNFTCAHLIKYDLYKRFGFIATAADRHLAEFCPKDWYLSSPERVAEWKFALTPISWRKSHQEFNDKKSKRIMNGEETFKFWKTGEEGIDQMRALLGLKDMVTNVNIPNYGQVPNLPIGACVEVNAMFTADNVVPVYTGPIPATIYPLISTIVGEQEMIVEAGMKRDLEKGFAAFTADPMVALSQEDARALFDEMVDNTKEYLKDYFK